MTDTESQESIDIKLYTYDNNDVIVLRVKLDDTIGILWSMLPITFQRVLGYVSFIMAERCSLAPPSKSPTFSMDRHYTS